MIWVEPMTGVTNETQEIKNQFEQEFKDIGYVYAQDVQGAIEVINSTIKCVIITTDSMAEILLPRVIHLDNVMGLVIFT